ncbi:hypothetical protein SB658_25160, partial [Bacillus sp. SIMBA_008]|uniref:hypothetical protein n=1 Tax=Bacillus sp. SIMBA_008 TaxID=3085757 RepID=UPI00397B4E81
MTASPAAMSVTQLQKTTRMLLSFALSIAEDTYLASRGGWCGIAIGRVARLLSCSRRTSSRTSIGDMYRVAQEISRIHETS